MEVAAAQPAGLVQAGWRRLPHGVVAQWVLVAPLVLLCYQFEWMALREWVRDATVSGSALFGLHPVPVHRTAVEFQGAPYFFTIACTSIDAFFGAIPFFLTGRWRSLLRLAGLFVAVMAGTVVRQVLGLVLFSRGVPWWLAHEAMAGVFYFLLLVYLLGERRRSSLTGPEPSSR
jgi:hypothetical protein